MVEFGVRLPNSGPLAATDSILKSAEIAEQLGYNSVWVHDHITWGTEQHRGHLSSGSAEALNSAQLPNFYECLTTLATIAGRTKTVKLGIAVVILPLRNPVVFAKQTSVIDVLSGGRLLVGVAPGAPKITEKEFEAVGVDYHKRGKITDDYIQAVRKLWTDPLPTYKGKFISFNEVQMFPKPIQKPHPPILIGGGERGLSDIALNRVVNGGNGWIPAYLTDVELEKGVKQLYEGVRKAGRSAEKFIVGLEMFTGLAQSDDSAKSSFSATLTKNFVSVEEGVRRSLVGTAETITKRMEGYANAGLDYVELKFMYSTIPEFHRSMETFAKDVLPSFK